MKAKTAKAENSSAEANEWELMRRDPPHVELKTNSPHTTHPYPSAAETFEVHSIPGAETLELYFDRRSSTEEGHDVVRVYAGDSFKDLLHAHSGGFSRSLGGGAPK